MSRFFSVAADVNHAFDDALNERDVGDDPDTSANHSRTTGGVTVVVCASSRMDVVERGGVDIKIRIRITNAESVACDDD